MSETIALVGSESLMGRELRELLGENSLGADVRLIASGDEASGVLAEQGGAAAVILQLNKISLADADVILAAGSPESTRTAIELAPQAALIDLTHGAEDAPRSRLRAPMVEPHDLRIPPDAIQSIAHPAAIALALVLNRVSTKYEVSNWVAHVFEPASERGTPGIEELQAQTVSLLSFKPMPKKVFDNQLSFAMLARLGEGAVVTLDDVETRIERHLATLLQNLGAKPMPSIRLVQAPVFHGHSLSIWMEFAGEAPEPAALEGWLASEEINVHEATLEPPNNVGAAGQSGISVGAITRDRNHARALWLWIAADNLRLAAQNAMLVAQELI